MSGGRGPAPRTLVIVNPASAGGRTRQRWPALRQALDAAGVTYDVQLTRAPHDATAMTRAALQQGWERIVVAGGDGTLNEAVNGFFADDGSPTHPEAILGVLPSGTGCDFRRTVGLPTSPAQLAGILLANHTRRVDTGRVVYDGALAGPRQFINIADCGVGGEVVASVNRSRMKGGGIRGTAVFLYISLRALTTFAGRPVRLSLDGASSELEIQNIVIANGRCFGGGMNIAPHARLDDGEFDVVVVRAMGRVRTLSATPSVYRGTHLRRTGFTVTRARQVRVEPLDARPLLFDIEGEQIGRAPATVTCHPRSLRLCVAAPDAA